MGEGVRVGSWLVSAAVFECSQLHGAPRVSGTSQQREALDLASASTPPVQRSSSPGGTRGRNADGAPQDDGSASGAPSGPLSYYPMPRKSQIARLASQGRRPLSARMVKRENGLIHRRPRWGERVDTQRRSRPHPLHMHKDSVGPQMSKTRGGGAYTTALMGTQLCVCSPYLPCSPPRPSGHCITCLVSWEFSQNYMLNWTNHGRASPLTRPTRPSSRETHRMPGAESGEQTSEWVVSGVGNSSWPRSSWKGAV